MDEGKWISMKQKKFATKIIHIGNEPNLKEGGSGDVVTPIHLSSTFARKKVDVPTAGYEYSRSGNPTRYALEKNLASLENAQFAFAYASGLAAITNVLLLLKSGDHVVSIDDVYGGTRRLFTRVFEQFGISFTFADFSNAKEIGKYITPKTKMIWLESPTNPLLKIIDIASIAQFAKTKHITSVVDNTFATPFCQRPIELGADFVVHSLTKGIGGFGTDMGGVVIGKKKYRDLLLLYRKDFGAVLNTKSAWAILTYGLPTLALRQRHQIKSAMRIAEFLNAHPKVDFVNYPGLPSFKGYEIAKKQMIDFNGNFAPGSLLYFVLKGNTPAETKEVGSRFMDYVADNAYTMTLAVSLGHTRTLIEHPASMTHSVVPPDKLRERGIDAGGVRLAIGLENTDDILLDLDESLRAI